MADLVHEGAVDVGDGQPLPLRDAGDASAEGVEDRRASDEVARGTDEAAVDDVDAVVESTRGQVEVAAPFPTRKVGPAVEIDGGPGSGRRGGVLGEVRVVADRQGEFEAADLERVSARPRGEDGSLGGVQVLLGVSGVRGLTGGSTRAQLSPMRRAVFTTATTPVSSTVVCSGSSQETPSRCGSAPAKTASS